MDDFFSSEPSAQTTTLDDPTADFLAREQAILGDDAALFASNTGDISLPATSLPTRIDPLQPEPQLLFTETVPTHSTGLSTFSSHSSPKAPISVPVREPTPEPEAIRKWKEEFQSTIAEKDAKSKLKKEQTLKEAKDALERFYAEYNDKKEKAKSRNKNQEKASGSEKEQVAGGNVWEQVVKQIDFASSAHTANPARDAKLKEKLQSKGLELDRTGSSQGKDRPKSALPKGKDTTRMKQLLQSLKKDPKAPGNTISV